MSRSSGELRSELLAHLEAAVEAFGGDQPLPGALLPRIARPAAPPAPQAQPPATPREVPPKATAADGPATAPPPAGAPPAQPPVAAPPTAAQGADALSALQAEVMPCTKCKLHQGRKTVVFGEGNPHAEVMFIGEAPGAVEDRTGRPFVGPAGQLLDRIIANAMGLQRADTYIGNINKCRPPGNRDPEPDEVAACLPFLRRQVAAIAPRVIVCLGRIAAQNLLGTQAPLRALRGRDLLYQGIPVVVTYHPAALLRNEALKRDSWEDIKRVNRMLGRPAVPPRGDRPGTADGGAASA